LPSVKTDLHSLERDQNILVWFGHSSYFPQADGIRMLVDPVLSGAASPVPFTTRSFNGADIYQVDDLPEIDILILTHDHWDHLDHGTVKALRKSVRQVVTPLGVGAHLERWGYDPAAITELDWYESTDPVTGFSFHAVPARHFSGRGFKRNGTLWSSFALITPTKKIFIGGDSGYDVHFMEAGKKYEGFDLAILENGQYNEYWKYIHMMPEETVQAALDLKAAFLFPVHWSKFSLALHNWDEPITRVLKEAEVKKQKLIHPMIGEISFLDGPSTGKVWWNNF
jgi:L-ascorbate metabolism protein UlaG (beta-lactamase superfamily)